MSAELTVLPFTGEIIELATADINDLARLLADVKDYESRLREAKSLLSQEVLRRQDRDAKWTTPAGGYVLKGSSPAPQEEFDALALRGHTALSGNSLVTRRGRRRALLPSAIPVIRSTQTR
jgi:hypothetical protein